MAPRLGGVRINPVSRFQGAWASKLSASSAKRWEAVFAECDLDSDGYVDRRETLVLLSRLGVRIPSDSSLKALIATCTLTFLLGKLVLEHISPELDTAKHGQMVALFWGQMVWYMRSAPKYTC